MDSYEYPTREEIQVIWGARILSEGWDRNLQHDILVDDGKIKRVVPHRSEQNICAGRKALNAQSSLIAPSLCHAHIHLDKCFLLSDPKYADLEIIKGDFVEAMELTSRAKARFRRDDLLRRGKWLISESIAAGVTHMRAFVEVDHIVGYRCLDAAIELKELFTGACKVQICAFAQEPVFSGPHGETNRRLMTEAISNDHVEVLGTTPYVEDSAENMMANITWAMKTALEYSKHLDLHLDYNLDSCCTPLTDRVVEQAAKAEWYQDNKELLGKRNKTIVLGHCTRLTLYDHEHWQLLEKGIGEIPLHFVGLPTSDLFMMGKPHEHKGGGQRVRGTLQIPQMIQKYGIRGAIAVNNVGNAFTPYGNCDPLTVASMGVGIYHASTQRDTQLLYECVSTRAREAIGYAARQDPFAEGKEANFVIFENLTTESDNVRPSRQRGKKTLQEVVYDPPKERRTIFKGHLITT
ncbi:hypothetical protein MMC28_002932 [Mycoblastus sanguinarius]|nr:hypothetical protein [Mycoblastus sanguinarius]